MLDLDAVEVRRAAANIGTELSTRHVAQANGRAACAHAHDTRLEVGESLDVAATS